MPDTFSSPHPSYLSMFFVTDPPKAPLLRVEGITSNSITASWRLDGDSLGHSSSSLDSPHLHSPSSSQSDKSNLPTTASVTGFILSYRRNEDAPLDEWESIRLTRLQRRHTLSNLLCGNKYSIKVSAFNEVGSSEDSDEIHFSTVGRPPVAPDKVSFIKSNMTSVTLNLASWRDGGCPISHFVIQYKPKSQHEWILLSNNILLEQQVVKIRELSPGTWHDLLILVKNEAGTTEANFLFATLTLSGATIAPMLLGSERGLNHLIRSPFDAVMVLVPSLCAILVLILVAGVAIYLLLCKRRMEDSNSDHCELW